MRESRQTPSHDYACCTYRSRTSSEFIKTFGIGFSERGGRRARSGPRTKTLKCVGKENTGAKQTQKRCNRLNHRKNPSRPGPELNDMPPRTVKRIPRRDRRSGRSDALAQQFCRRTEPGAGGGTLPSGAQACFARSFSPRSALPRPKLNAELTSTRHCGIELGARSGIQNRR